MKPRGETTVPGTQQLLDQLTQLSAFNSGLAYLGPGEQYISFWTSLAEGDASKDDSRIFVDCTYRSANGSTYQYTAVLDFSELKGICRLGESPLPKIAKHLETLTKDFQLVTSGSKRLNMDTYTTADREDERAKWVAQNRKEEGKSQ